MAVKSPTKLFFKYSVEIFSSCRKSQHVVALSVCAIGSINDSTCRDSSSKRKLRMNLQKESFIQSARFCISLIAISTYAGRYKKVKGASHSSRSS